MAVYNVEAVNEALNNNEPSIIESLEEACDYMMSVLGLDESRAIDRHLDDVRQHNDEVYTKYKSYKKHDPELAEKYLEKNTKDTPGQDVFANYTYSGEPGRERQDRIFGSRKNYETEKENNYHRDMSFKKFGELEKVRELDYIPDDKLANKKPGKYKTSEGLSKDHEARDQKKKAIKETCLHILSILDDIE